MKITLSTQSPKAIRTTPEGFVYLDEVELSLMVWEVTALHDGGGSPKRPLILLKAGNALIDLDPHELLAAVQTLAKLYGEPGPSLSAMLKSFMGTLT